MHLFLPPEGSFVCVAPLSGMRWRAAAGELNVFTNNKLLVQEVLRV